MNQLVLKLLLIALMFVLSVVFGLLPLKMLQLLRQHAASLVNPEEERKWPSLLLCLLTCFSGGVFLATCFLHLLPEVIEKVQEMVDEYKFNASYPVAELVSCAGFFLVFLIEELVILCLHRGAGGRHHHQHHHHHHSGSILHVHVVQTPRSCPGNESLKSEIVGNGFTSTIEDEGDEKAELRALRPSTNGGPIGDASANKLMDNDLYNTTFETGPHCGDEFGDSKKPLYGPGSSIARYGSFCDHGSHSGFNACSGYQRSPAYMSASEPLKKKVFPHQLTQPLQKKYSSEVFAIGGSKHLQLACENLMSDSRCTSVVQDTNSCGGVDLPVNAEPECCEDPSDNLKDPPIKMAYRPHAHSHGVRSVTLVIALSFHSVIEGLAFGIQDSTTSTTMIFLGIIIHKCVLIFSTGVQLARTHAHQLSLVVVTIVLLALMSPLGAGIGVAVEQGSSHSLSRDMVIMMFSGLSVGTFIYVTFFEVLIHERDNEHNNLLKLLATLIGFGLMAGLRVMEHSHGHAHSDVFNSTILLASNSTANTTITTL